jgi:hypothetical protein
MYPEQNMTALRKLQISQKGKPARFFLIHL